MQQHQQHSTSTGFAFPLQGLEGPISEEWMSHQSAKPHPQQYMTLESQSALLKIMASKSATATPSSTNITMVINLPLLSKADLSSAFCIVHDSQQDFWLTKCFWRKYCSAATWNKTLVLIRPSSFPGGVSLTSSEYCPIALPKFFIHHPKYPSHILPSCHEEAQMQPSSDLHTPCAHQHANSIATPVTLDHLICWTC